MPSSFARLGVPKPIGRALARRGIEHPSEIQAAAIADTIKGRDVCGRAPTGSGKTLAFGIPLVATIDRAISVRVAWSAAARESDRSCAAWKDASSEPIPAANPAQ